jgi:hypothetical protein
MCSHSQENKKLCRVSAVVVWRISWARKGSFAREGFVVHVAVDQVR